jgi:hypothetical protein
MFGDKTVNLSIVSDYRKGTIVKIKEGHCRLVGRFMDQNTTVPLVSGGQRLIAGDALVILNKNFRQLKAASNRPRFAIDSFTRQEDLLFDDVSISHHHALLLNFEGELSLVDMGSRNGTRVNEQPVTAMGVKKGDVIALGQTRLRVE